MESREKRFEFLLLLLAGFLVYANSINGDFVFDDNYNIRENPFIQNLRYFWSYFTDARTLSVLPENAPYRPLSTLSFALMWWLGSGAVWVFHVQKIILHVLIAWLSLRISRRLLDQNAGGDAGGVRALRFAALLFVIHPSLSEPVNYISSLTSVQCAFFFIAAFWAFLEKRTFLMVILALASMLTKEEGASFPIALFLYSWVFRDWRRGKGIYAFGMGSLFIYLVIRHFLGSKTVFFGAMPWNEYFYTQLRAWVYYVYKVFTPWGYSVEHYSFGFSKSLFELSVLGSAVLVAGMLWKAYRWARPDEGGQARPFLAFGWGWYVVCLLPASSIFPLTEPINEHRYYLSFALFLPALVFGLWRGIVALGMLNFLSFRLRLGAMVALSLVFAGMTVHQNTIWRTEESLWADVVRKDPANGRALNNLGTELMARGRMQEALELFVRSEQAQPGYKYAMINQVICLLAMQRVPEARQVMHRLTTASDGMDSVVVHYQHAKFLYETERKVAEALPVIERCNIVADRKYLPCLALQIWIYQDLNRLDDMMRSALEVQSLQPGNRDGKFGEGMALIFTRRYAEALAIFDELHARNPNDLQALHNTAWLRMQLGDYRGSRERWERKLKLVPGDHGALSSLKEIAEKLGQKIDHKIEMGIE